MKNNLTGLSLILMIVAFFSAGAFSQTTEFTYQGDLQNGGSPANGSFDFEFLLFDAVSGGAQTGSTLTRPNVTVTNGIFSVKLDFGANFPGANRFLEIRVKPAGGGAFTPLAPRQAVTSAPYSVTSLNAATAGNVTGVVSIANGGTGSSTQNFVDLTSNQNIAGNKTFTGTLSANIVNAATQYNLGGSRVLSVAGANNFFAGVGSGGLSGTENTFVGSGAGQTNSIGSSNSFFGWQAGKSNTTGSYNTYFGAIAGFASDGAENSFFGERAGYNTTGSANTFVGRFAGETNTTGSNNVFIGYNANPTSNGLNNAIAIGPNAQVSQSNSLVLGNNANVGIGTSAPAAKLDVVGNINTSTQYNIGGSRVFSIGGNFNTFAGAGAGQANPTGDLNSFFGKEAGFSNTTGNANSFFGATSGKANTSGSGNSYFGIAAGGNGTGSNNSFFGVSAGLETTGNLNSFFGNSAGITNTTGSLNSFFGYNSGLFNTTGQMNSFFGLGAGYQNTQGGSNSFFGQGAGGGNTTGNFNSFFGYDTGNANTIGSDNTLIGNGANVGFGNLTNATAIGANALVSQSNSLVLGSINGVSGALADTKVGIGTSSPIALLDVVSSSSDGVVNTAMFQAQNIGPNISHVHFGAAGDWYIRSAAYAGKVVLQDALGSGNVGIGISAPTDKLHVNGIIRVDILSGPGSTPLCRNASNQISTCSASIRHDNGDVEGVSVKEQQAQIEAQQKQIEQQRKQIESLTKIVCAMNSNADICQQLR